MTLEELLKDLRRDMVEKLDPTLPQPFGEKGYVIDYITWTGRKVGIYPAMPQGYVMERASSSGEERMVAYVAVDIDTGSTSLTATIPYLDALVSFFRKNYSDIQVVRAFIDTDLGPKNNQGLVSVLLACTLDFHDDRNAVEDVPKFL